MGLNQKSRDLLEQAQQPFNIIEEYAALSPKRKVLLCDNLFIDGKARFHNMVKLLWPEAKNTDMKNLEKFLLLIRSNV
ncbi:MAG: hypothetical protein ACPGRX_04650 [Bdellovibrionales bacterium]